MNQAEREELKRAAEAATVGTWWASGNAVYVGHKNIAITSGYEGPCFCRECRSE